MSSIECRKCGESIDVENILSRSCSCGYERRAMIADIETVKKNARVVVTTTDLLMNYYVDASRKPS